MKKVVITAFLISMISLCASCSKDHKHDSCDSHADKVASMPSTGFSNSVKKDSIPSCCVPKDTVDLKTRKLLEKIKAGQN